MNRLDNILCITMLALLCCEHSLAMPVYVDSLFYARYTYVHVLDEDETVPQLSDEEFFDRSASIIFPVAKTELPSVASSPLLTALERDIIPHFNSDTLRLVRIDIRGAASPEGRWAHNQQLGQQRTEALLRFFAARMMVGNKRRLYNGACTVILRAGRTAGKVTLTATAPGLKPVAVKLQTQ